jgi:hypothetical protein
MKSAAIRMTIGRNRKPGAPSVELRQLVLAHAAHAELRGLEIDHEVDRHEVEHRRDDRSERDLGVGDAGDLGHDEGARAHDRRHDLAAGLAAASTAPAVCLR